MAVQRKYEWEKEEFGEYKVISGFDYEVITSQKVSGTKRKFREEEEEAA
jgi:hypothetical protein